MGEPVKQRCVWVDAARCLAMVCILWLHAGGAPRWLGGVVGGSICFFFLLAGYFMPREAGAAAKRALQLGLAWLLWSALSAGLYALAQPEAAWTWQRAVGWGVPAYNTPLWFLRNLCIYQLLLAGMIALRLLPRYKWLALFLLLGFTYAAEPAQHVGLRFDWLPAALLGYNLKDIALQRVRDWLVQHARALVVLGVALFVQCEYYPLWLAHVGLHGYSCSLPAMQLCWAVGFALLAIGLESCCKRFAHAMAQCGSCMLFIYAGHSLAFAPFYIMDLPPVCRFATMMLVMVFLTILCRFLLKTAPAPMRYLMGRG